MREQIAREPGAAASPAGQPEGRGRTCAADERAALLGTIATCCCSAADVAAVVVAIETGEPSMGADVGKAWHGGAIGTI